MQFPVLEILVNSSFVASLHSFIYLFFLKAFNEHFSWLTIMLDAIRTERGSNSPSRTKGRRQRSNSLYSVREKLLREHIQGTHSAEGYGEDDGHEMF